MRPIDADELMRKYCGACSIADNMFCLNCKYHEFRVGVKEAPTIEPEVRHGRWIAHDVIENMKCSECGEEYRMPFDFNANVYPYNFCPNCGAKMDGGADNG